MMTLHTVLTDLQKIEKAIQLRKAQLLASTIACLVTTQITICSGIQ